jgi:hypothetical protein
MLERQNRTGRTGQQIRVAKIELPDKTARAGHLGEDRKVRTAGTGHTVKTLMFEILLVENSFFLNFL